MKIPLVDCHAHVNDICICNPQVAKHPDTVEKILVGTDFPIGFARAQSQLTSLEGAGLRKPYLERIARNRLE